MTHKYRHLQDWMSCCCLHLFHSRDEWHHPLVEPLLHWDSGIIGKRGQSTQPNFAWLLHYMICFLCWSFSQMRLRTQRWQWQWGFYLFPSDNDGSTELTMINMKQYEVEVTCQLIRLSLGGCAVCHEFYFHFLVQHAKSKFLFSFNTRY